MHQFFIFDLSELIDYSYEQLDRSKYPTYAHLVSPFSPSESRVKVWSAPHKPSRSPRKIAQKEERLRT